jgi:hypothetical protein
MCNIIKDSATTSARLYTHDDGVVKPKHLTRHAKDENECSIQDGGYTFA